MGYHYINPLGQQRDLFFHKKFNTEKVMGFWKHKEVQPFWQYGNLQET